jgi:hypothetical protein
MRGQNDADGEAMSGLHDGHLDGESEGVGGSGIADAGVAEMVRNGGTYTRTGVHSAVYDHRKTDSGADSSDVNRVT